jgi:hypothetical protein
MNWLGHSELMASGQDLAKMGLNILSPYGMNQGEWAACRCWAIGGTGPAV